MRRWRRLGLRARLVWVSTAVLAVGLALGSLLLFAVMQFSLLRTLDDGATRTASDVAALVEADRLPDPIPLGQGSAITQVVDAQGRITAASVGADRLVPLLRPDELRRARAGQRLFVDGDRAGMAGELRVVAVPAGGASDPQTVVVAVPLNDAWHSLHLLRVSLSVAFPLLVVALALLAWRMVGATLRPVEALRRSAEEITGDGRLPLPEARDELYRLAATLNDMLDRLAAARARQRAFVADAAHELRSPLANMRTELEVAARLHDGAPPGAGLTADLLADLLADVERLSALTDDLLLLARLDDAAAPPARRERVDVGQVAGDVAERYAEARVPVTAHLAGPLWTDGDPAQLDRIVANLVDNAVRHATSRVSLTAARDDTGVLVTVTDDGPGIPAADRERVFDRFTRLDDARARDAGGAGLGLAIVRDLVRRHRGTVHLTDAGPVSGPGVRAEVRLPLSAEPPCPEADRE